MKRTISYALWLKQLTCRHFRYGKLGEGLGKESECERCGKRLTSVPPNTRPIPPAPSRPPQTPGARKKTPGARKKTPGARKKTPGARKKPVKVFVVECVCRIHVIGVYASERWARVGADLHEKAAHVRPGCTQIQEREVEHDETANG